MGYIVQTRCINDQQNATDVFYGSLPRASSVSSGVLTEGYYEKSGGAAPYWNRVITENGVVKSSAAVGFPTLPSCDATADFFDGMTVGWGIAAAALCAFAVVLMRRGL